LETRGDQQARSESKTRLVEQVKIYLHSGDYSRALDLLRGTAAEFPNDAELSALEELAHDGVKRNAEGQRLITESQELFAQGKSAEAIQLLRKAHELDKNNSLARAILANALVEHANSIAESDWLEAEKLTNQALALNPAHPTAKTIFSLIVELKKTSSVEDWVSRARKVQSSGDLFAALAWVAEGLAVHPHDPKLLQIQDTIQRDQAARRRQARRVDLEELRRMELEIAAAVDDAARQALAERIQGVVAKYWTDGEILAVANGLLNRLGLAPPEGSAASRSKSSALIFHVPRAGTPKPSPVDAGQAAPSQISPSQISPSQISTGKVLPEKVQSLAVPPTIVAPSEAPAVLPEAKLAPPQVATVPAPESPAPAAVPPPASPSAPAAKVASPSPRPAQRTRSNSTVLILVSGAAIILVAATFFFTRKYYAPAPGTSPAVAPSASAPPSSAPAAPAPAPAPAISAPAIAVPAQTTPEPSPPALPVVSEPATAKAAPEDQPRTESSHRGTLLVIAGQDGATVFLNGKLQPQPTQAGQLRIPNLEAHDYVVRVSKSGFQDPPQQEIRIRTGEQARLVFNLQPQPRLASLAIQGGTPGAMVFVDQNLVGTIQPDGKLSVSTVNPGDHTVELRKAQFKPRQLKEHFVVGGAVSLAAADVALEAAPGELKINFAPADAKVALVKGNSLTIVSSGVPLNLGAGTYTLTARTADRFARSSTLEVIGGQSKTLDLSLAPAGMSKWDDPGAWKQEKDSFIHKGGDFVLYSAIPVSGTFVFSAMPAKGHLLQWVLNYADPRNYILFQLDDNNFYRSVIRNGEKTNEIKIPEKEDKKGFRTLRIRVSPTEVVHEIKDGDNWAVVDRWRQSGVNFGSGKFGFYIPGNDEVALSSFAYYADLNVR
jgi:tetratricopeptide (TPR) repeat protein